MVESVVLAAVTSSWGTSWAWATTSFNRGPVETKGSAAEEYSTLAAPFSDSATPLIEGVVELLVSAAGDFSAAKVILALGVILLLPNLGLCTPRAGVAPLSLAAPTRTRADFSARKSSLRRGTQGGIDSIGIVGLTPAEREFWPCISSTKAGNTFRVN